MAQAKTTTADKVEKANKKILDGDIARKIWLAGVGVYGRAYSEAQGAAGKFAAEAGETFDQLVAKGEAMEDTVREAITKAPAGMKVVTLVTDVAKKSREVRDDRRAKLDARIGEVRKSLAETLAPFNMAALGDAVANLTVQVEALTEEVAALKAEKARKPAKAEEAA